MDNTITYNNLNCCSARLYLYTIRADNHFYNISPTVAALERRGETFTALQHVMMGVQQEVVAVRNIPTENIQSVTTLIFNPATHEIVDGISQTNAAYRLRRTNINPGVIPGAETSTGDRISRIAAFGFLFTSCFYSYPHNDRLGESSLPDNYYGGDNNSDFSYDEFYDAVPLLNRMVISNTLLN